MDRRESQEVTEAGRQTALRMQQKRQMSERSEAVSNWQK